MKGGIGISHIIGSTEEHERQAPTRLKKFRYLKAEGETKVSHDIPGLTSPETNGSKNLNKTKGQAKISLARTRT